MNRSLIEKLKSLILVALIFAAMIQMGILWRYQNHGLPISILDAFFSGISNMNMSRELDDIKGKLFAPEKIIVSDTLSLSHWPLESSSREYKDLWTWAQTYLVTILDPGFKQRPEIISSAEWDRLIAVCPFAIMFDSPIKTEMVKLFIESTRNASSNAPPGLYKMLIAPWEDFNNNNTVYIFDGSKIYKYKLAFLSADGREKYRSILKKVSGDDSLVNYSLMQELDPGNRLGYPISRDVPVVNRGPKKSVELPNVYGYIPEDIAISDDSTDSEMDAVADIILGRERDNYDDPELNKKDNTLVMRNQNSQYKLYQNGLLEYEYLGSYEEYDEGSLGDAFINALVFINGRLKRIMIQDSGEGLFLSGSRQVDRMTYEFTFDYKVGDFPVLFNEFSPGTKTGIKLKNAITIRASGRRVLSCWWVIRDFETGGQSAGYNMEFKDLMRKISDKYLPLFKEKQIYINDIGISLFAPLKMEKQQLKPVWKLDTSDNAGVPGLYIVDMSTV